MARPKRIPGEKTARERMEDAFWEMLAEMPYDKMTGKEICARANVSHNSFYYHFENMDDMARQIFDCLIVPEIPAAIMQSISAGVPVVNNLMGFPDAKRRFDKMCLLASSGSPFLMGLVRQMVLNAWLGAMGLEESDLTPADRLDLTFALGGALTLLGSGLVSLDSDAMREFSEREMGRGVMRAMASLAQKGKKS